MGWGEYKGDFVAGQVVRHDFNSQDQTGLGVTLTGSPVLKAWKDGSTTTEVTTGVTLSPDHDGLTGAHQVAIDTSDAFFATGSEFAVKFSAGAANGVSVVGLCVCTFSISRLQYDPAGVTTLLSRLSAARAGYLDNLSAGAVALEASLQSLITTVGAAGAGLTATATAVWAVATRLLTAGTNIVLAKGTGITGFNDPTAAATASAVRAELATELARIDVAGSSRASQVSVNTVDDFLDTEIADIQSRLPDALTANGLMKSDAQRINSVGLQGAGTAGDPMRAA